MHLLLFDLDGTLLRTGHAGSRALTRALQQHLGVEDAFADVPFAGRTDPVIVRQALRQRLPGRFATPAQERTATERIFQVYLPLLEEEVARSETYRVLPGVTRLLEGLRADVSAGRILMGLGTGNVERGARIKLARGDLNRYFPFGGFSDDDEDRPRLLQAAVRKAQRHGGLPIDQVTVIGDTPLDVAAARAIGARVVAVATGSDSTDSLAAHGPDAVLPDLTHPDTRTALGLA